MLKKLIIISFLFTSFLFAQVSSFSPKKPVAGDTVKIIYNPYADSAKYSINDDVYAVLQVIKQNGDFYTAREKMVKTDSVFVCNLNIANNTACVTNYFVSITNGNFDINSIQAIRIYSPESKPVVNAFIDQPDIELINYPNNYGLYRDKWLSIGFNNPDSAKVIINKDMKMLEQVKDTTPGLLYSLSNGYSMLKDINKSYLLVQLMVKKYPGNAYTAIALQKLFLPLVIKKKKDEYYAKINKLINEYAVKEKSSNAIRFLVNWQGAMLFSDSTLSEICPDMIANQEDNPIPYSLLAFVLTKKDYDKDEILRAEQYCEKAINLTLEGKLRIYSDYNGSHESEYLAFLYSQLAKIKYLLKNYSDALSNVITAINIFNNTDYNNPELEGDIWYALRNYDSAEEAYLKAWKFGSKDAKEKILNCYEMNNNDTKGFENYFSSITKKDSALVNENNDTYKNADPFEVISLSGKKLSLQNLKGKIIVLNFWFTGCTPCKAEIPQLNQLVAEYKNKGVTFIAFALDEDKALLNKYLKLIPFKYEIVPGSEAIAKDYKITAYPTNLIINQKGEIIARIVGGSTNIGEDISRVIDRTL